MWFLLQFYCSPQYITASFVCVRFFLRFCFYSVPFHSLRHWGTFLRTAIELWDCLAWDWFCVVVVAYSTYHCTNLISDRLSEASACTQNNRSWYEEQIHVLCSCIDRKTRSVQLTNLIRLQINFIEFSSSICWFLYLPLSLSHFLFSLSLTLYLSLSISSSYFRHLINNSMWVTLIHAAFYLIHIARFQIKLKPYHHSHRKQKTWMNHLTHDKCMPNKTKHTHTHTYILRMTWKEIHGYKTIDNEHINSHNSL